MTQDLYLNCSQPANLQKLVRLPFGGRWRRQFYFETFTLFVIAWFSTTTPAVSVGPDFDSNHGDNDDDDDDDDDGDDVTM